MTTQPAAVSSQDTQFPTSTILVVDDVPQNVELMLAYLETLNCTTHVAVDGVEGGADDGLELVERAAVPGDDVVVPREEAALEGVQQLVDHRRLGVEVVVEAAGEDPRGVGDVAHRGVAEPALGEQATGDAEKLLAPPGSRACRGIRRAGC